MPSVPTPVQIGRVNPSVYFNPTAQPTSRRPARHSNNQAITDVHGPMAGSSLPTLSGSQARSSSLFGHMGAAPKARDSAADHACDGASGQMETHIAALITAAEPAASDGSDAYELLRGLAPSEGQG